MEEEQNSNSVIQESVISVFPKTFLLMFLGLLATGIVSWYTYSSGLFIDIITGNVFNVLLIVELLMVILFSALFRKLPYYIVEMLFFTYAIVSGVTFSVIFVVYEITSVISIFFVAAAIFAIFAIYGYVTKADLSKIAPILFITLIAGIIVSVINIFIGNPMMDIVISWVLLIVFFGITAYDMQKIKRLAENNTIDRDKLYVYGAMELYLDFINIFLRILSLFGKRR